MSRLRELRLHGFKTFADPTRFVFEPGVNAVIGPNGSGKSNMADAVRWVLGEQSNRSLRTRKSDDVIFAGSQQRKPQGMAEAVLMLDNADGWLPIDFAEVSIGRRAYRSGESEYLVNGARARLRDVVALLGEGRLGANELVVVGQGTVDAALSLRPEERRQLFEEAAGVKNLQVRKNEALARLGKARDNLTRVGDLAAELKPQVRRLALQAQHQQEHDDLLRRARAMVGESHRRRERSARDGLGEARRAAASAEASLEALQTEHRKARTALDAAEERYWDAEKAARDAGRSGEATRETVLRAENRLESLAARRDELAAALEGGERDAAELEALLAAPQFAGLDGTLEPVIHQARIAEAAWQAAITELTAADARLLAAEDALAEARQQGAEWLAARARRQEARTVAQARRERLEPEIEKASIALEASRAELDAARTGHVSASGVREAAEHLLAGATGALTEAQRTALAAREADSEVRSRSQAIRSELAALQDRADPGSRLSGRLVADGWELLLDALDAPEEAWPAIEALVGGELGEALLWRDDDPAPRLSATRGSARLLRQARGEPGGRDDALRAVGAKATLAEWIGMADAPEVLRRTAVAPDLAALRSGWARLPEGWLAVTPTGDLADGRGVLTLHGRAEPAGGSAARRHARRRELSAALASLAVEQQRLAGEVEASSSVLAAAERALREARVSLAAAERIEREAAAALEALEARHAHSERELRDLARQLDEVRAARMTDDDAARSEGGPSTALDGLVAAAVEARRQRDASALRRDMARGAWSDARQAAETAEARTAGERRERPVHEARLAQLRADLPARRASLAGVEDELVVAEQAAGLARREHERAVESRAAADARREQLRGELRELEHGIGDAGEALGELERAAQAAIVRVSRQEEALGALARERELALEGLPDAAGQRDESEPVADAQVEDVLASELAALDDATLETELRRVRRTLGQIGSVNPFAVEEHRELAARLEELTSQDADLSGAIGSTEELLGRLDLEIGERFNAAFAAIGERFDEFCQLLFDGGSASLQMSDGSDGEPPGGIEIVVRPPGKRLQRLAMLSGGERALTGVALLFAMLSVNPVPFCILDEVDAALDEANIGRFAEALHKLSETTDFVVITHNRATIEVADTIYGVTMTDAAVSRILSLRLADIPLEVSA